MKDRGYLPTTSMKRTITEQLLSNFQSNFLTENIGERQPPNKRKPARTATVHTESLPEPETDAESDISNGTIQECNNDFEDQPNKREKMDMAEQIFTIKPKFANKEGPPKNINKKEELPKQSMIREELPKRPFEKAQPLKSTLPPAPAKVEEKAVTAVVKPKRSLASREANRRSKAEASAARKSFLSGSLVSQGQIQQQVAANSNRAVLRKDCICELFSMSEQQAREVVYLVSPYEDPFWTWSFMRLRDELMRALIYKLREQALAKMRTVIVRRVLDDFVVQQCEISEEQQQHLAKHNRRITSQDIQRYADMGLPPPPSRMTAQYLAKIFSRPDFRNYFVQYVSTPRLGDYLATSNLHMVQRYARSLSEIGSSWEELHVKQMRLAKITRRPLFQSQIQEHFDEAKQIAADYCQTTI